MKLFISMVIMLMGFGAGLRAYNPDRSSFESYLQSHGSVVVPEEQPSPDSSTQLLFGSMPRPDSNAILTSDYALFSVFTVRSRYGEVTVEKTYLGAAGIFMLID